MKVPPKGFHLNGHTAGFNPQTQKLDHRTTLNYTLSERKVLTTFYYSRHFIKKKFIFFKSLKTWRVGKQNNMFKNKLR